MSRKELIGENNAQKEQIAFLRFQLNQLQNVIFGAKRERFVPESMDNQLNLFSQPDSIDQKEEAPTEEVAFTRKKKKKHLGRNSFTLHCL